ncbi:MAG: outer membrane beta-barrel protein [Terricaulis sp.]
MRLHPAFSVFAAALIGLVPLEAHAQDASVATPSVSVRERPRPEYDPQGMRFGGFDLNASVDVGVASTDNLFAVSNNGPFNKESDLIYTVSPEARLSSHWTRNALSVAAGVTRTGHQDFASEDSTTGFVSGQGRLDVGSDTSVSAGARWARQVEPRTNIDAIHANTGEPSIYDTTQGSVSISHNFNYLQVQASAARTELNYHDVNGVSQNQRDSNENDGTLRVEYAVSPRIGIVGQATFDQRKYDNVPGLSSDGRTLLAGIAVNLTDLMKGQITAGQFKRDYNVGPDVQGTAIDANLQWYVTQLTTLSFSATRNAGDQDATTQAPYVESSYGAHVDHELLRNLILSAGVQTGSRDFRTINRHDDFTTGELGAQYILNRRVALTAKYRHDSVDSNVALQEYDVNTFSLGLSLRL